MRMYSVVSLSTGSGECSLISKNASAFRRFLRWAGLDHAVANVLLSRAFSLLAGPVTLVLVASQLTREQQGYYYTFGSVLGLTVFVELGVAFVVTQFSSHEKARLTWSRDGLLEGDAAAKSRLASILRSAMRWYAGVAVLVIVVIAPAGLWFFGRDASSAQIGWRAPWLWVVVATAANCAITPVFAVLEGCGQIAQIGSIRLVQQAIGTALLWGALGAGWGLFASPILSTFGFVWGIGWLVSKRGRAIRDLLSSPRVAIVNWRHSIWPMQWRIALTWLSGYFIYQLFNPLVFQLRGAAAAGQMGMSLSQATAITHTSVAWVSTKGPRFGEQIALGHFEDLDKGFTHAFRRTTALAVAGGLALWLVVAGLRWVEHPIGLRFLPLPDLALLMVAMVMNVVVAAIAVYLRAHREEPLLLVALVQAFLVSTSAVVLGRQFGATGMMSGYVAASAVALWMTVRLFRRWRSAHGVEASKRAPCKGGFRGASET